MEENGMGDGVCWTPVIWEICFPSR